VLAALTRGTPVIASKDRSTSPAKEFIALAEMMRTSLTPVEEVPVVSAAPVKSKSRFSQLLGN